MHRMLKRQLRKAYPNGMPKDAEFTLFVEIVNQAYKSMSEELRITERSLDLSCEELNDRHNTLSKILDALPDMSMWLDQQGVIRDIRTGNFDPPLVSKTQEHGLISEVDFIQNSSGMQKFLRNYQDINSKKSEIELNCGERTYFVEARITSVSKHRWLLVIRDISIRRKLIELQTQRLDQIKRTQKQLQGVINAAPTGILISDESNTLVMVNQYICQKLSMSNQQLLGKDPLTFITEKYRPEYQVEIERHKQANNTILDSRLDLKMQLPNHKTLTVEMAFSTLFFEDKKLVITAITDIGERKSLENQLRILASTDPLTGAYNRRFFNEISKKSLVLCRRQHQDFSVLMLDLDFFKKVNDIYGHATGDQVLIATVNAVRACIRESDILGRYGGEEFVVALPNTNHIMGKEIATRICLSIEKMVVYSDEDKPITFTASLGLVTAVGGEELEQLMNLADKCLYFAKENGRNQVVDFDYYKENSIKFTAKPLI